MGLALLLCDRLFQLLCGDLDCQVWHPSYSMRKRIEDLGQLLFDRLPQLLCGGLGCQV